MNTGSFVFYTTEEKEHKPGAYQMTLHEIQPLCFCIISCFFCYSQDLFIFFKTKIFVESSSQFLLRLNMYNAAIPVQVFVYMFGIKTLTHIGL